MINSAPKIAYCKIKNEYKYNKNNHQQKELLQLFTGLKYKVTQNMDKNVKKHKKIFKDKKQLIKYLQQLPVEIKEFQLQHQQETKLAFSQTHKDKSINIDGLYATVDSTLYSQGQVTLNKKLQNYTEWRMKMCGISLASQFGICEVDSRTKKIGKVYGLYSQGYAPAQQVRTGYQFQNDTWIRLVYNPQEKSLTFFNETTKKKLQVEIPEKKQYCDYYPYAFLYKATVYLNEEPDQDDPYDDFYQRLYQEEIKAEKQEQRIQQEKKSEAQKKLA